MCPGKSACSAISRCRCWSATTSSPRIDLKTDRKNKKLLMQKWNWVGKGAARAPRKDYKRRIEEELIASSGFNWRSEFPFAELAISRRLVCNNRIAGGVMDTDKSILEKFTETVKDVAKAATDAPSLALKADAPALKADERAVAYMPLAADGLVSDPLMVPPVRLRRRGSEDVRYRNERRRRARSRRRRSRPARPRRPPKRRRPRSQPRNRPRNRLATRKPKPPQRNPAEIQEGSKEDEAIRSASAAPRGLWMRSPERNNPAIAPATQGPMRRGRREWASGQ